MTIDLVLSGGGRGRIVESDGNHVTIVADVSSPPGSTLVAESESLGSCRIKVRGCKRAEQNSVDSGYRIDGRFVNLSRSQRRLLLSETQD